MADFPPRKHLLIELPYKPSHAWNQFHWTFPLQWASQASFGQTPLQWKTQSEAFGDIEQHSKLLGVRGQLAKTARKIQMAHIKTNLLEKAD